MDKMTLADCVEEVWSLLADDEIEETLTETLDAFVNRNLTFEEKVKILSDNAFETLEEPMLDTARFETIVDGCIYNLIETKIREKITP